MEDYKFILNIPVQIEENLQTEFKEVKGGKPVNTIKNTVDEYAVAFLNRTWGSIFWGIRDSDRTVVGVYLDYNQRDNLRNIVVAQLANIKPPVSPRNFSQEFHPIFEDEACRSAIPDLFVLEVGIIKPDDDEIYFTGGNEAFIKTESGKMKLSGLRLKQEYMLRLQRQIKNPKTPSIEGIELWPGMASVLRRAQLVSEVLVGSQVSWIDDNPGNNIYERMAFKSIGITVEIAISSEDALLMLKLQNFDAIISDIKRNEDTEAGLQLLRFMRSNGNEIPAIFYVANIDEQRGVPRGAFGITRDPEELIHLILDILERTRI